MPPKRNAPAVGGGRRPQSSSRSCRFTTRRDRIAQRHPALRIVTGRRARYLRLSDRWIVNPKLGWRKRTSTLPYGQATGFTSARWAFSVSLSTESCATQGTCTTAPNASDTAAIELLTCDGCSIRSRLSLSIPDSKLPHVHYRMRKVGSFVFRQYLPGSTL
jgi:hypothetical protein